MTSIAEPAARRVPSWPRIVLLLVALGMFAAQTPAPWGMLWWVVPITVGVSLLSAWRFGIRAVLLPVALFGLSMALAGPLSLSASWIPVASLTGVWMGLREEGAGPSIGERAWMLLPLLLLASLLPWTAHYPALVQSIDRELKSGDAQLMELARQVSYPAERLRELQETLEVQARLRSQALPRVVPTALFLWMAVLVMGGRALAARLAASLRWPPVSRTRLSEWRLPDGALWLLIAGLGLVIAQWTEGSATGWTLLLNAVLGFGVQGIAVVESVMLARGVPLSVIILTMSFVFVLAMPVFLLAAVAVGLSDVWLDYRRLEAASRADGT